MVKAEDLSVSLEQARHLGRTKSRFLKATDANAASTATAPNANLPPFEKSIRPLLTKSCLACHGPQKSEGRLRIERLESLLNVVGDEGGGAGLELLPVAGAGLRLLLSQDGSDLRRRLLLTLIRDDRLSTSDLRALLGLIRRTFSPRRVAGGVLQSLNPLAVA